MPIRDKRYSTKQWRFTRGLIKARDKDTCYCGRFAREVHHIRKSSLYPELFFDVDNLIMVCNSCHKEADINNKTVFFNDDMIKLDEYLRIIVKERNEQSS